MIIFCSLYDSPKHISACMSVFYLTISDQKNLFQKTILDTNLFVRLKVEPLNLFNV